MAAIHVDTAVGVYSTAVTRHVIGEDTVLHDDRDIVFCRCGDDRYLSILRAVEGLGPVTVHKDTTALEIGLGSIVVGNGVGCVNMVGATSGDLDSVELGGTGEDREVALLMEMVVIIEGDGAGHNHSVAVVSRMPVLKRLRPDLGGVRRHRDNVIDMREIFSRNGITGENGLALQLPRLDHGVEVVIAHRAVVLVANTDFITRSGFNLIPGYRHVFRRVAVRLTRELVVESLLAIPVALGA